MADIQVTQSNKGIETKGVALTISGIGEVVV